MSNIPIFIGIAKFLEDNECSVRYYREDYLDMVTGDAEIRRLDIYTKDDIYYLGTLKIEELPFLRFTVNNIYHRQFNLSDPNSLDRLLDLVIRHLRHLKSANDLAL